MRILGGLGHLMVQLPDTLLPRIVPGEFPRQRARKAKVVPEGADDPLGRVSITVGIAGVAHAGIGGGIARNGGTGTIFLESCIVSDNVRAGSPNIFTTGNVTAKNSAITDKTGIAGSFTDQGGNIGKAGEGESDVVLLTGISQSFAE